MCTNLLAFIPKVQKGLCCDRRHEKQIREKYRESYAPRFTTINHIEDEAEKTELQTRKNSITRMESTAANNRKEKDVKKFNKNSVEKEGAK